PPRARRRDARPECRIALPAQPPPAASLPRIARSPAARDRRQLAMELAPRISPDTPGSLERTAPVGGPRGPRRREPAPVHAGGRRRAPPRRRENVRADSRGDRE